MTKYSIYRLYCLDETVDGQYIGSAANLKKRLASHRYSCNNNSNISHDYRVYKYIRENGGWDKWTHEIIEEIDTENIYEVRQKEQEWIIKLKATLNSRKAKTTKEETNSYYGKDSEWYKANLDRAKKRYADTKLRLIELEAENKMLKNQMTKAYETLQSLINN